MTNLFLQCTKWVKTSECLALEWFLSIACAIFLQYTIYLLLKCSQQVVHFETLKVSQKVVHNDKFIIILNKDTVPWLLYTCTAIIWTLMFYVYKAHPCRLIHTVVLNRVGWTLSLGMRLIVKVGQIISIHYVWSSHTCYLKSVKLCILK